MSPTEGKTHKFYRVFTFNIQPMWWRHYNGTEAKLNASAQPHTFLRPMVTYPVTDHVRPHQPISDQQGLGLRGLVDKEAHPVIPDLHVCLKAFMLGASTAL